MSLGRGIVLLLWLYDFASVSVYPALPAVQIKTVLYIETLSSDVCGGRGELFCSLMPSLLHIVVALMR